MSKSSREKASRKLIDHVVGAADLGRPRALLATTFDLNPDFFEADFLPALLRLPALDDRRVRTRIQLEGELAKMDAVAIVMEANRYQGRPKSLRVDLRAMRSPTGGVLHAKVNLLVYEASVRLTVASANLTTSGYRENREVAFALTANKKDPEAGALIRQLLDGMPARLAPWWSDASESVRRLALAVLDEIAAPGTSEDDAFLWGGGEVPLWRRVLDLWPANEIVQRIRIVSPFWSDESGAGPLSQLVRALRQRNALVDGADVLLVTDPMPETITDYRPTLPDSYRSFDARALAINASAVAAKPQVDEEDVGRDDIKRPRRLHAKVLLLEGKSVSVAYAGSANFTTPGWGLAIRSRPTSRLGLFCDVVAKRESNSKD